MMCPLPSKRKTFSSLLNPFVAPKKSTAHRYGRHSKILKMAFVYAGLESTLADAPLLAQLGASAKNVVLRVGTQMLSNLCGGKEQRRLCDRDRVWSILLYDGGIRASRRRWQAQVQVWHRFTGYEFGNIQLPQEFEVDTLVSEDVNLRTKHPLEIFRLTAKFVLFSLVFFL